MRPLVTAGLLIAGTSGGLHANPDRDGDPGGDRGGVNPGKEPPTIEYPGLDAFTKSGLAKKGPELHYHGVRADRVTVSGYVVGGWPFGLDLETPPGVSVIVEIRCSACARKRDELFIPAHAGPAAERRVVTLTLPGHLGGPHEADLSVQAVPPPGANSASLRLFALAAGPDAVGSVNIRDIQFSPSVINAGRDQAAYGFLSLTYFDRVCVEFVHREVKDQQILMSLIRYRWAGPGIAPGERLSDFWDGRDHEGKFSAGLHLLQIRAWRNQADKFDWIFAWSENDVLVRR